MQTGRARFFHFTARRAARLYQKLHSAGVFVQGTPASSVPVPQHSLPARCMRTPYFARPRPPPAGLHAFCTLSFHFTGPRPHMAPPARCAQALHFAKLRPPANRAYPLYAGPMPRKAPPARKQGPPAVRRPLVSQSHARPGGAAGPLYIGSPFHRGAAAGAHFSRAAGCVFSGKYAPAPSRLTTLAAPSARRAALPLQVTQAAFPHCGAFALSTSPMC